MTADACTCYTADERFYPHGEDCPLAVTAQQQEPTMREEIARALWETCDGEGSGLSWDDTRVSELYRDRYRRYSDAVIAVLGRRGGDDAARVRRVRELADELDADAKRHDDAEPIDDGGLTRMILAARFSRDAARRIRRALDGDDRGGQ